MTDVLPRSEGSSTWDDFVALEDDDRRELVAGHLVEIEVPDFRHEVAVACVFEPEGYDGLAMRFADLFPAAGR